MPNTDLPESCYLIIQRFPSGEWGPAAMIMPGLNLASGPALYTGSKPETVEALRELAEMLHETTQLPTAFVRFDCRVDVARYA